MIEGFNSNRELGIGGNLVNKFAKEILELLKSEKEKNRQKFIETIEDVCKGLPFIQRQLKEAIKDEK